MPNNHMLDGVELAIHELNFAVFMSGLLVLAELQFLLFCRHC